MLLNDYMTTPSEKQFAAETNRQDETTLNYMGNDVS